MTFAHLDDILAEVEPLGKLFVDAGYRLFLVGGIVRDQVLDEPLDSSSDIDLTTDALPSEIKRIVAEYADALWLQGEKFGTIGLRAGGRDYEITTHRAESYADDSRKPQVSFGDDIHVDLSRRDFTVNAMAIELPNGELVDPYGGVADLEAGILRTPLSADISFTDDPLRMLRAARFSARFYLRQDDDIIDAASRLHERVRIVAIERIGVELRKLLGLDNATTGLAFLAETFVLREVLSYGEPELLGEIDHRLEAPLRVIGRLKAEWRVRLAVLGLMVFEDVDGVNAMCRRLRLSRDEERFITRTSRSALAAAAGSSEPSDIRRWIATCEDAPAALMLARSVADDVAHVEQFQTALDELGLVEDLDNVNFIDGDTIMSTLGIAPGPAVGQGHAMLKESYFQNGPLTEAEQVELVRSWWTDRTTNT